MTLNQIVKRIEKIITAHKQLRSFKEGGNLEAFLNDKDTKYAAAFLLPLPGTLSFVNKSWSIGFRLWLIDMVHISEETDSNELEVQSDMVSVAMDVFAQMNRGEFDDWRVSGDNPITTTQGEFAAYLAGCYVDFSVKADYTQNTCQVPTTFDGFTPIDIDMKNLYDFPYTATGAEGKTLTIPELKGKRILLITRDSAILYKASNLPDSTQYTWDLTDIGLGTDLTAGQHILILYRNY